MTTTPAAPNPPARFNFAGHLLACNAARPAKVAVVDDQGSTRYGELDQRVRRMAAALQALGVRREERVLLLMHDSSDWIVSFLGALYAGIVPVAANTLLTAPDYAYMLAHCRAQAVLVSAALLPPLQAALASAAHEVKTVIVSRAETALPLDMLDERGTLGMLGWDELVAGHSPQIEAADTGCDQGFWRIYSGQRYVAGNQRGRICRPSGAVWLR